MILYIIYYSYRFNFSKKWESEKMRAIVFGGTGFIGSHVVEQLHLAGHQVTVAVRGTSDISFLKSLGINAKTVDFTNFTAIRKVLSENEIVYNCLASGSQDISQRNSEALVEITLTKRLIEAAILEGISRFIQLSTIVIYDFKSNDSIDEKYISHPEYDIQKINLEREKIVREAGERNQIETIILRPASTIGSRDAKSFFSILFMAHLSDQFPIVGNGEKKVSIIDTRDIGRAMEWLGTYEKPKEDNGVYLLKGFDTTWYGLKTEIDWALEREAKTIQLPTIEKSLMIDNFMVNRIWNDEKIKSLGFNTKYSLSEAVETAVNDLRTRK